MRIQSSASNIMAVSSEDNKDSFKDDEDFGDEKSHDSDKIRNVGSNVSAKEDSKSRDDKNVLRQRKT